MMIDVTWEGELSEVESDPRIQELAFRQRKALFEFTSRQAQEYVRVRAHDPQGTPSQEGGSMSRYYNRLGQPIPLERWIELMDDDEYRRVASTRVRRWLVSTVWLGLDHNVLGHMPLIFETMVFDEESDDKHHDLEMERYTTECQALLGHDATVQRVSEWKES